jgi:hypothetical protein
VPTSARTSAWIRREASVGADVERPARRPFRDAAAPVLFGVWLAAVVAVAVARPGELLEVAMVGVAGAAAWELVVARTLLTPLQGATVAACFALPLTNTLPARKYDSLIERLPVALTVALSLLTLLLVAVALVGRRELRGWSVPRLLIAAGACLVAGGVVAALLSVSRLDSLSAAWFQLVGPALLALLVFRAARAAAGAWAMLDVLWLAATVPAVVGIAAYVSTFGFPTSGDDLVAGKIQLYRPFLFQDVTFGNVDNTAPFVLLVLPLAVVCAARTRVATAHRIAAAAASLLLGALLLLTLSRASVLLALVELAVLGVVLMVAARPRAAGAVAVAVCACMVIAVGTSASSRQAILGALSGTTAGATSGSQHLGDPSVEDRRAAIRTGLRVARRHLPQGVGPGLFARYSPRYTAAHSLPVQTLAEDGVLGAAGLALLLAFVAVALLDLVRGRRSSSRELLLARIAALGGSTGFLLAGIVVGVPLALGQDFVWSGVLAVLVGVLAGLHGVRDLEPARA